MTASIRDLRILIATSNPGKLRDFEGAARAFNVEVAPLAGFAALPQVVEDGATFAENARKKAEGYSRHAGGQIVLADDSGLEVMALNGLPGVRSARYAGDAPRPEYAGLTADEANNARLLAELREVGDDRRQARFVCMLAAAREGRVLATFEGEVRGVILRAPRGTYGFGYDPLFFVPKFGKTTAELPPEEKARISHRGKAFAKFLEWMAGRLQI